MNEPDTPLGRCNETFVRGKAPLITKEHIDSAIARAKAIQEKIEASETFRKLMHDIGLCQNLLKDYQSGRYRDIPVWIIAVIAFALLYLVSPIELIPDVIPVIGYLDDAALVTVAVRLAQDELRKYSEWKRNQPAP